ncbi:MAG: serine protease [Bacteroidales bacterium]|nr:serine protease [Bacteroidales bacterium]MCM1146654.1 serine protease [Bacteroidales bacterium]MCM1206046.1 serine protease [Bacillota bacterium]MCM1511054.1 serine protease [Clostridium sp.]
MKVHSLLITIISMALLCSCAHKSGHRKPDGLSAVRKQARHSSGSGKRSTDVPVGNNNDDSDRLDGSKIFAKYNTAVFMVYTSDGYNTYQGSGFFINGDGLAVSNYHVFKGTGIGNECIKLSGSKNIYKVAEIIHRSEDEDFIIFRVGITGTSFIPVARQKPKVGEKVYAIGSPKGLENTFSSGEVSQWRDTNLMQISALIDHGSSGGALINEYGEVVGITSGTFYEGSQANLNYAWSIDVIKPYVKCK